MAKKIAAILARVSRPTQNLDSQIEDLLKTAKKEGYKVPAEYIFSEKISGMKTGFRKSHENLLQALDQNNNHIEAVFIWEITRLSRGAYDFVAELMQINKRNVPVYFLDMDIWTWDFKNNCLSQENCDKLVGASTYGRLEWDKIKDRTKRGRDAVAEKGLYVGHLADGYIAVKEDGEKHIRVDTERADVIENIFMLFINGKSTDEIAKLLNARKVPTTAHYRFTHPDKFNYSKTYRKRDNDIEYDRTKSEWSGGSISTIVSNTWYVGKRYYNYKEYHIDAIISEDVWEKAKQLREEKRVQFRTKRESKTHHYLLSNLVVCGKCGKKFYGHFTGKNNHYFCSSVEYGKKCGTIGINKENFEAIVCTIVRSRALYQTLSGDDDSTSDFFKTSDSKKKKIKQEIEDKQAIIVNLEKDLKRKQSAREKYYELFVEEDGDKKLLKKRLKQNEKEQFDIKDNIEKYSADVVLLKKSLNAAKNVKSIVSRIQNMSDNSELRELLKATVKKITVYSVDKSINYVEITYVDDKQDNFIYSYKILKHDFLTKDIYTPEVIETSEPTEGNGRLQFDPEKNVLLIPEGYALRFNTITQPKSHTLKPLYKQEIDFRSFIYGCLFDKDYQTFKLSFDPTNFIEDDERRDIQTQREKEYQAKRRSGLPTTLPFVVRDGNYDNYLKHRKKLYNRRCKIKKHKSMSQEEKKRQLDEIDVALALLREKIKRIPREEQIRRYKEGKKQQSQ